LEWNWSAAAPRRFSRVSVQASFFVEVTQCMTPPAG
jgi:hypothetical protein